MSGAALDRDGCFELENNPAGVTQAAPAFFVRSSLSQDEQAALYVVFEFRKADRILANQADKLGG